jgi:hypothetical protein
MVTLTGGKVEVSNPLACNLGSKIYLLITFQLIALTITVETVPPAQTVAIAPTAPFVLDARIVLDAQSARSALGAQNAATARIRAATVPTTPLNKALRVA